MNPNLTEIKRIADSLDNVISERKSGYSIVEPENGNGFFFNLLNIPEISVSRSFFSAGTKLENHVHDQKEYVLVYKGQITVFEPEKGDKTLNVGDCVIMNAGVKHSAIANIDSWIIAVTIPCSPDWPRG